MKTLDTTHTLYTPERANQVVSDMAKSDPDWSYKAIHDPKGTGHSFIEIRDENDDLVGRL